MRSESLVMLGRGLMLGGLLIVGVGFLWAMRIEAQESDTNPLAIELVAVAVGFMAFTIGRWCAAKGQEGT